MAAFKKAKSNTFKKTVTVFCGEETLGDLDLSLIHISEPTRPY